MLHFKNICMSTIHTKKNSDPPVSSEPDFYDLKVELLRAGLGLSQVLGSDGFPANLMLDFIKTSNASLSCCLRTITKNFQG